MNCLINILQSGCSFDSNVFSPIPKFNNNNSK